MMFNVQSDSVESEKERNLYTKFFGSFFFNEFCPGYELRLQRFSELLFSRGAPRTALDPSRLSVTFDFHAYMLCPEVDNGELADILIHCPTTNVMVAIEAKYLEGFDFESDIEKWMTRIQSIELRYPSLTVVPCLLLSHWKWKNLKRQRKKDSSNYRRFQEKYRDHIPVVFWEDLDLLFDEPKVRVWLERRLALVPMNRKDLRYDPSAGRPIVRR